MSETFYRDYTNEMLENHLLLLGDHLVKLADAPDEQCLNCAYWHSRAIEAYAGMEGVKFVESEQEKRIEADPSYSERKKSKGNEALAKLKDLL